MGLKLAKRGLQPRAALFTVKMAFLDPRACLMHAVGLNQGSGGDARCELKGYK
jgi:hypothetical protein